ncbi:GNAT family N-acetyltransferase [Brucella gallinifaecis]|uniref:GNAT family N-acetyltransferase n=1 Tax=Brucella gallinifaecis TaxID=215590 RepID=A0A502BMT7_9HYPH|nr:GNAT family N-acetyltransferase [Brucella gallinifaecis]TPF75454.1 GNAT family N-acetyltransferase [Brucella gallinifaecis]
MTSFIHALKSTDNFTHNDPVTGRFSIRLLQSVEQADMIAGWVNQPYARFWNMGGFSKSQVLSYYQTMQNEPDKAVFIGFCDDQPAFLAEIYDPLTDSLSDHYRAEKGDCGMHLLVAPPVLRRGGFTLAVMRSLLHFIFSEAEIRRIVVEPDIRNHKIHRLNCLVGFTHIKPVQLPDKMAYLGLCRREDFFQSLDVIRPAKGPLYSCEQTAHLSPCYWEKANRHLLRKMIAELSHEEVLQPQQLNARMFQITAGETLRYEFAARRLMVDHWLIDGRSLKRLVRSDQNEWLAEGGPDALEFLIAIGDQLDIGCDDFPLYLEEISSTLYSACYKLSSGNRSAEDLCHAEYQDSEAAMSEGHPVFIANNGRIGFNTADYLAYAPETARSLPMTWLAVSRSRAVFSSFTSLTYKQLIEQELDAALLNRWRDYLVMLELEPDDYYFMPVHPWQWQNKIAITFAAEVAQRHLVWLGEGDDIYRPQQSIRTFFNITAPHKHYVKTALSILNMGFMRGLSPEYMSVTPAINEWLVDLLGTDAILNEAGFTILREVAAIGYQNPVYSKKISGSTGYGKMLAALWRESPQQYLKPGERLMTMAALLHQDADGKALTGRLIAASGQSVEGWICSYLKAYYVPLIHCFYHYDLAFMPHGENLIMVMRDCRIERMLMKDIGEEIGLMNSTLAVPEEISRISYKLDEALKRDHIFTDVFDGFFRHLSAVLDDQGLMKEQEFWALVAEFTKTYQMAYPHNADKYQRYDLFRPVMTRNCFNRLQLRNNRQMLDLLDPQKSFRFGTPMVNPLAQFA